MCFLKKAFFESLFIMHKNLLDLKKRLCSLGSFDLDGTTLGQIEGLKNWKLKQIFVLENCFLDFLECQEKLMQVNFRSTRGGVLQSFREKLVKLFRLLDLYFRKRK